MVTGQPVTDQGGTQYSLPAGVFRFPLVAPGNYRLEVLPPGSYAFPSQRTIADLQTLPGAPFRLQPGSFGQTFVVTAAPAVAVDVPLDPPATALRAAQDRGSADRDHRRLRAVHAHAAEHERDGRVQRRAGGRPAAGRRALPRGLAAPQWRAHRRSGDGGRRHELHLHAPAARPPASPSAALRGRIHHRDARHEGRHQHRAGVRARQRAFERSALAGAHERRAVLAEGLHRRPRVRRHLRQPTAAKTPASPNVRVYLEDGRYGVTDENGRFHFEGLEPGTHTVQLDKLTLPEYLELAPCADRMGHAGRDYSQFAELRGRHVVAQRLRAAPEGARRRATCSSNSIRRCCPDPDGDGLAAHEAVVRVERRDDRQHARDGHAAGRLRIRAGQRDRRRRRGHRLRRTRSIGAGEPVVSAADGVVVARLGELPPGAVRTFRFETRSTPAAGGALTVRALALFDSPAKSGLRTQPDRVAAVARRGALRPLAVHVHAALRRAQDRAARRPTKTRCATLINSWRGARDITIRAVGHADSQPISGRNRKVFADNYALSRGARADGGRLPRHLAERSAKRACTSKAAARTSRSMPARMPPASPPIAASTSSSKVRASKRTRRSSSSRPAASRRRRRQRWASCCAARARARTRAPRNERDASTSSAWARCVDIDTLKPGIALAGAARPTRRRAISVDQDRDPARARARRRSSRVNGTPVEPLNFDGVDAATTRTRWR